MKRIIQFFLIILFAAPFAFSQVHVIDNFENGDLGHFNATHPNFSGSSVGFLNRDYMLDSSTAFMGAASMHFVLYDDTSKSDDWSMRFASGTSAALSQNDTLGTTGYIGYALKVTGGDQGLTCGIGLDAPSTASISDSLEVIRDGEWHFYEWNLEDTTQWHAWVLSDGTIADPVSIDAIWMYAPNGTPDVTVNLDYVAWNPTENVLPVELISFKSAVSGNNVELHWITASEINNAGFEVQRRNDEGIFAKVGYINGKGTTTEANIYTFNDKIQKTGKYQYRLKQVNFDGTFEYSNVIEVNVATIPGEFSLAQNYPNPFNPSTQITYNMPEAGHVTLSVYNLIGEKVVDLVNGVQEAGAHTVNFNAKNLASGTYIYRVNVNGNSISKKMMLMK